MEIIPILELLDSMFLYAAQKEMPVLCNKPTGKVNVLVAAASIVFYWIVLRKNGCVNKYTSQKFRIRHAPAAALRSLMSVWSCACGYISFPPIFISLRLKTDSDQQRGRLKLDICSSRRELLLNLLVRATLLSNNEIDVANTAVLLIEDGWATTCDDLYHEE